MRCTFRRFWCAALVLVALAACMTATGGWHLSGGSAWMPVTQPGRYHLEIRIHPLHLAKALGAASQYADKWVRWVVGNPVVAGM